MEVAAMQATANPDAQGLEALTSDGGHLAGLGTPAVVPMAAPCGMGLVVAPSVPSPGQASGKARGRGQWGLGSALPPDKSNACKVGRVLGSPCVGQAMLLAMASMPLASVAFDVHSCKRGFCKRWRCTRQWTAIKAYSRHCCATDALGSRGQLVRQAPQGHERRQRLGHTPRWSTVQLRAGASTCRRTHGCTRLAQRAPQSTRVHICNKARRPPEQLRREAPEIVFGLHHVDARPPQRPRAQGA